MDDANNGTKNLDVACYTLDAYAMGLWIPVPMAQFWLYSPALSITETLGPPRIAAMPNGGVNITPHDWEVAVKRNDNVGSGDLIEGFNYYNLGPAPIGPTQLNTCPASVDCIHERPALAYVGDYIIVSWTVEEIGACRAPYPMAMKDVVARRLVNQTGLPVDNCFSIVNISTAMNQSAVSVARQTFETSGGGDFTFFSFYDDAIYGGTIGYKLANFMNTNLKAAINEDNEERFDIEEFAATGSGFQIFPNPFSNEVTITAQLKDDETAERLEIYNVEGKQINLINLLADGNSCKIKWDGKNSENTNITSGVYFIKLITNQNTFIEKLYKN